MENKPRWFGIPNRYFILLFIIISVLVFYVVNGGVGVIAPYVTLPAEIVFPIVENFNITNTLIATLLADFLLILMAISVRRAVKSGSLVPKGFSGAIEGFLEVLYNLTESTAGKFTAKIFPFFATITLLVLVVNWMELVPGVDSIGWFQPSHVHFSDEAAPAADDDHADDEHGGAAYFEGDHARCTGDSHAAIVLVGGESECAAAVVPFVRVASTDLNFTMSLAVISVVMTQVIGVQALGAGYFTKFWNTKTLFAVPVFGVIDFAVGLLEIVAEIAKVLSFTFRLFGNIFAGSILLFVIGSLVPVFAQSVFLMLEFFVGLIQAIVFGMLTMTFMAQATISHDHGDESH